MSRELSELQAFKQRDRNGFDVDPNNQARINKSKNMQHNFDRSQSMAANLENIGLSNTAENNDLIIRELLEVGKSVNSTNRVWIPSEITGPKGSLRVNSTWIILPDGRKYLSTLRFMPIGD